ncbi:MAG: molybdopterin cofactor-binding domain-containing protein, partial [Fulvivirga sp.]|nr:molybdopterin cofactor-binding domain-containing protein [Fulvivirga sp.]
MSTFQTTRRGFLKTSGMLTLGFSLLGCDQLVNGNVIQSAPEPEAYKPDESRIDAWLRIFENGEIEVITGKQELGQGIRTAIMQVAADELNTDIDMISVHMAETGYTPNERYTAGSRSIESSAMSVRNAAATAREMLLQMSAEKLGLSTDQLTIANGAISNNDGQQITFQELLNGRQLTDTVTKDIVSWGKTKRKWVGKPIPRRDIEKMVTGELTYVQDLRFPGMVHARVVRPSGYDAKLETLEQSQWAERESLLKLVRNGSFVAVVCEEEYEAIRLKQEMEKHMSWKEGAQLPAEQDMKTYLKSLPADEQIDENKGNTEKAFGIAEITHRASYFKPYIMHAANGPSCAVAKYEGGQLDIWTHSQGVYPLRSTLANMLSLPERNIHVKGVHGSGCYGHNGADDVAAEAALIAMEYPGKHIRLQWMREDENAWEPYGTAMVMELQAGLDGNGRIRGWKYDVWSDGHSTRPGGNADALLPARYLDKGFGKPGSGFRGGAVRNAPPYYQIEDVQ